MGGHRTGIERARKGRALANVEMTSKNISDDAGSVTPQRYPEAFPKLAIFTRALISLVKTGVGAGGGT